MMLRIFCVPLNGLPVCNFLHVPSTVKIPLFVLSIGYWWQVQSYLRSTITFSCPTLWLKHGSQSDKIIVVSTTMMHWLTWLTWLCWFIPKSDISAHKISEEVKNVLCPTLHHFLWDQREGTHSTVKPRLSWVIWSRVEWIIECLDD